MENVFPPLITEQLWNDAHERLQTRKHESTTGFVNIFAGLLKCDHCGKGLGLSNTKDHSNYYVCNTYKKKARRSVPAITFRMMIFMRSC